MANSLFSPGLLPADNPISQWVAPRRNAILGFGAGMLSPGLSGAATGAMQGMALDRQYAMDAEEQAKEEQQLNQTIEFMRSKGWGDLVARAEAGDMQGAWTEANARGRTPAAQDPTSDMQNYQFYANQELQAGRAPVSFMDFSNPANAPTAPAGYQWTPEGTQAFIPGGPADPANMGKTTEAQRRNQQLASVIQPELAAVEQNWDELASGGNQAGGMVPGIGNALTSPGYQQASNSLATIAQSYLYSVSGAAATDAEVRKIVDSVTPKPFESQASIDSKLARIRQMADAVIQAGGAGTPAQAPGGQTSSGLQWSLEP